MYTSLDLSLSTFASCAMPVGCGTIRLVRPLNLFCVFTFSIRSERICFWCAKTGLQSWLYWDRACTKLGLITLANQCRSILMEKNGIYVCYSLFIQEKKMMVHNSIYSAIQKQLARPQEHIQIKWLGLLKAEFEDKIKILLIILCR